MFITTMGQCTRVDNEGLVVSGGNSAISWAPSGDALTKQLHHNLATRKQPRNSAAHPPQLSRSYRALMVATTFGTVVVAGITRCAASSSRSSAARV